MTKDRFLISCLSRKANQSNKNTKSPTFLLYSYLLSASNSEEDQATTTSILKHKRFPAARAPFKPPFCCNQLNS